MGFDWLYSNCQILSCGLLDARLLYGCSEQDFKNSGFSSCQILTINASHVCEALTLLKNIHVYDKLFKNTSQMCGALLFSKISTCMTSYLGIQVRCVELFFFK